MVTTTEPAEILPALKVMAELMLLEVLPLYI